MLKSIKIRECIPEKADMWSQLPETVLYADHGGLLRGFHLSYFSTLNRKAASFNPKNVGSAK